VSNLDQQASPPQELPNTTPPSLPASGQTRLLIQAIEPTISDIRGEMRGLRDSAKTDFKWLIGGFILIGGMVIAAYFRIDDRIAKLEDKFHILSISSAKIETKLDDLLQRIPPVVAPPVRR
jgi:hypothetical protein